MNNAGTLPTTLVEYLKTCSEFNDMDFFVAYDNSAKPVPIIKPIITICTKRVAISNKVNQVGDDGKIYLSDKRNVTTVVKLTIHVPYSMGSSEAFRIFDEIYSKLLFSYNKNILVASCSGAEYIRDYGSIVLTSEFSVKALENS